MLKKLSYTVVMLFSLTVCSTAQDVATYVIPSPVTSCTLPSSTIISVLLRNNGPTPVVGNINVSYQINTQPVVTESTAIASGIGALNTFVTFSFATMADLSAPGTYTITCYVSHPGETNFSNDTVKSTIVNYAPTVGGSTNGTTTVCASANNGSINLLGNLGEVTRWEESLNQSTWTTIFNTTSLQTYSNLISTTYYRAIAKNGVCSEQASSITTITVTPSPSGGTLSGSSTFCYLPNNGTINLSGHLGAITSWEYSQDGGSSWTGIVNTTTTQTYSNLTQTTLYKALVSSGACPIAQSSVTTITVHPLTVGGTVANGTACIVGNSGTVNLTGNVGNVMFWEFSTDGGTSWTNVSSTAANLPFSNITQQTIYRANVQSGTCVATYSAPGTLSIVNLPVAGSISSSILKVCANSNNGELNLSGYSGTIQSWEFSTDNINFTPIANSTPVLSFTNIAATTKYRSVIASGSCPVTYTNTVEIEVSPITKAGNIIGDNEICPKFNEGKLALINAVGSIVNWEKSTDKITFTEILNTSNSLDYKNVEITTYYRTIVKSGVCNIATSSIFTLSTTGGPKIELSKDTVIDVGDEFQLESNGGVFCLWQYNESLSDSTIYNPIAAPRTTTTYYLTVRDNENCENRDSITVTVEYNYKFKIPNIFTPNNDGYNDFWKIKNLDFYPSNEVYIHNRNGQEVFYSSSYKGDWDGTNKGKTLPNGIYFYTLRFNDSNKIFRGSVTILRGD